MNFKLLNTENEIENTIAGENVNFGTQPFLILQKNIKTHNYLMLPSILKLSKKRRWKENDKAYIVIKKVPHDVIQKYNK